MFDNPALNVTWLSFLKNICISFLCHLYALRKMALSCCLLDPCTQMFGRKILVFRHTYFSFGTFLKDCFSFALLLISWCQKSNVSRGGGQEVRESKQGGAAVVKRSLRNILPHKEESINPEPPLAPSGRSSRSSTEVEVTEIILTKLMRFCQLWSHSRGFLSRLPRAQPMDFFCAQQDTIL